MDTNERYQYVTTNSMASITKKPNSKFWFACFRDAQGRQRRRSTEQTGKKKALEVAKHYELLAQHKIKPSRVRETISELYRTIYGENAPSASLGQYVENWLAVKRPEVSSASFAAYSKGGAKFLEYLGQEADREISEISRSHIVGFRNDLAKKVTPTTCNHDLKTVKMIFRAARRDGYIMDNPAEFVDPVKRENDSKRQPFKVPEIQAVLAEADPEWQSLIKFGLYTGQRLSDIASLAWLNIDLDKNVIRLKARKTGKQLTIPIAAPLRAHILALASSDDPRTALHPRAFATLKRQGGNAGNISNQFADLLAAVGLREPMSRRSTGKGRSARRAKNELSFHSLRHTAVTLLKDAGVPEAVVMELVGHDSKEMSKHYTHVGQEALAKAAAALPEV